MREPLAPSAEPRRSIRRPPHPTMRRWLARAAACCLVLSGGGGLAAQQAASAPRGDALIGVWKGEVRFGPPLAGELTVRRLASGWSAEIGGARAAFRPAGDSVRFDFGGRGAFRGERLQTGEIAGFWVQPAAPGPGANVPGGVLQPMATPLVLRAAGGGRWRGTVVPLEDRFTLYLKLFRGPDGALVGAFRNPEANAVGGAAQYRVRVDGDSVRFAAGDTARPSVVHAAALTGPGRLRLDWRPIGRTLELTRQTEEAAADFFPRPPGGTAYAYRRPPATGDGWATARARDVGLDEAALERTVRRVISADPAARRPLLMHSLLIARHGKLVLEEYFYGTGRGQPHDVRSAGKTFASVMLGAAMRRGAPLSPDTRVYALLAGPGPAANPDARKERITLAHLMTHTSGLACDDNDPDSPGNEGTMQSQSAQPDWWRHTLDLPVAHDPGTRYAYCSAGPNLVGGALTRATGTWLPELFARTVARPLGFGRWYWNLQPTGEGYQGGGAYLRPRDLLKIGQVYLDGGTWRGRRIVDSAWVRLSTAPHAQVSPETTGLSAEDFGNFYGRGWDGWLWHLGALTAGGRSYRTWAATGNGGQVLVVVPELDLAAVFTGADYGWGGIWGRWAQEVLGDQVIAAMPRR